MSWVFSDQNTIKLSNIVLKVWYKKTKVKNRKNEKNLKSHEDVLAEVEDFET